MDIAVCMNRAVSCPSLRRRGGIHSVTIALRDVSVPKPACHSLLHTEITLTLSNVTDTSMQRATGAWD